jgi:hypothetical protein
MNEFTKEEIKWLYEDIVTALGEHMHSTSMAYRVTEKLKVMIDDLEISYLEKSLDDPKLQGL